MYLKAGIILEKLSVALLNVLDGAVLVLRLASVLLQKKVQVSACRRDLLKQESCGHQYFGYNHSFH
jgi:hypothetical protein